MDHHNYDAWRLDHNEGDEPTCGNCEQYRECSISDGYTSSICVDFEAKND